MVCDLKFYEGQKAEERRREVEESVKRLEMALGAGSVKVLVGPEGSITFVGWNPNDRKGVSDLCAYRKLSAAASWSLRQAVAKAEVQAGRKVNAQAIGSGVHSHDGGKTWGKH